jgi:16S rRNA (guanine527-N7)-methyltransferase
MPEADRALWAEAARDLGVSLEATALDRFDKYLALLNRWAASVNLVGTRDPDELALLHVADSLAPLRHLGDAGRVIDVGSGAGLPGAILASARPTMAVTSLEPIHKKHAFLSAVKRELRLESFRPLAERDDQHRMRDDFVPYDAAISRATFAPAEWLTRGAALVRPGGLVVAMEGREQIALPADTVRYPYALGDRRRALLVRTV